MSNTKIKAAQFYGVVGNGTNGYFLVSDGNGGMSWVSNIINPTITNVDYPGTATAADPSGGESITLTGTGFKTGATVTIGGTAAPSVSYVSATQLTITTPAKTAGDYDIVVTNTDTGSATYINGISYNGIPAWTTAAGSLGTFASGATISTITLQASEPDAGTITFNITNGALPTGLSLTGANIDGTTSLLTAETLYTFTVTATDDENQATPRTFTITVQKQFLSTDNFTINTYTGNGSTQSVEGKIGTAAVFNGTSSKIELPNNAYKYTTFTVSLFAHSSDWTQSLATLYSFYDNDGTNGGGFIGINNDVVCFFGAGGASSPTTTNGTTTLTDNTWYHILLKVDGISVKVYLNGTEEISITLGSNFSYRPTHQFTIGARDVGANTYGYFNGKIDQVRIFNTAVSDANRTTLGAETSASATKSTTDIFADGSGVALYEFEKGAIDTGGVSGYIGSGGIFNGSSSKIVSSYTSTSQTASISMWVYVLSTSSTLKEYFTDSTDRWIISNGSGSSSNLSIYDGISWHATGTDLTTNTWQHVCVVRDGNNATVYLDGSSIYTTSSANSDFIGSSLTFGAGYAGGNEVNGRIDQIRIFNKALISSEVTTLYGETSASATKSTTDIFDDGSGVALYELKGNANDTGKGAIDSGQSAVFNGSNSRIYTGSTFMNVQTFSVSAWINFNTLSGTQTIAAAYEKDNQTSGDAGWIFRYLGSSGTLNFGNLLGSTWSNVGVSWTPNLNQWYHVSVTRNSDGSEIKFYVNGSQLGTTQSNTGSIAYTWNGGTSTFTIGGILYVNTFSDGFNGKIDDVRTYSDVLTSTEVGYIYNNNTVSIPTANLAAHYKLDNNTNDETTNYNGTASNITYTGAAEFPTYNGTATNVSYAYDGTPTNVSFVGTSFQPDLVWIKNRDDTNPHALFDSVRGAGKFLSSQSTAAETGNVGDLLGSFDAYGFQVNRNYLVNTGYDTTNGAASPLSYVAWCWKAGGAAVTNNQGSRDTQVSANTAAGFSIITLDKPNTNTDTYGHGLSQAPELIILKRTASADDWYIYHKDLGNSTRISLNSTAAKVTGTGVWGSTTPTSSVFTLQNQSGGAHVAYCFHFVDGYQKIGSYTGTGASGNSITTGFKPRFLMIKNSTGVYEWVIVDSTRGGDRELNPNSSVAENGTGDPANISFTSTGFVINNAEGATNQNNATIIYLAIA